MTPATSDPAEIALVTGASSGLGAELAEQIARDGSDVILTARRTDHLKRIGDDLEDRFGVSAMVISKDLADPNAPKALFDEVRGNGHRVGTLVNTAGFGVYGSLAETSIDDATEMMQVNMVAPTHLTRLFVEPMVERGSGVIVNTSGLAAYIPLPRLAIYAATRAYLRSFSEALAHELAQSGVQVTTLCPGSMESEFFAKAGMEDTKLAQGSKIDPAAVAERAWAGIKAGKRIVKPGIRPKLLSHAPRLLPETTVTAIGARTTEPPHE